MSAGVLVAVLLAAGLHAGWNTIVKVGDDRFLSVTYITLFSGLAGLVMIPIVGVPIPAAWPWLATSVCCHTGYRLFLARAYTEGDLGQVYPLARGTAPLIVAIIGFTLIGEPLHTASLLGILVLCGGIMVMALRGGSLAAGMSRQGATFALVTSVFIAGYTLVDGLGARANGSPHSYAAWLFFLDAVVIFGIAGAVRGRRLIAATAQHWKPGLAAGVMSVAAYWIVIWAMTQAPIALVAALRESSVLFASVLSVALLHEHMSRWRAAGAVMILAGIVVIRLT